MDGAAFAGDTFGIGCQFPDTGEPGGEGREGQIWGGGQPGPEMDIIQ